MRKDILQLLEDWAHGCLTLADVHNRAMEIWGFVETNLPMGEQPPDEEVILAILHDCFQRQAEHEMVHRRVSQTSSSTNTITYKVLMFDAPAVK